MQARGTQHPFDLTKLSLLSATFVMMSGSESYDRDSKTYSADILTKRRDKRRQLSNSALDLRDPVKVLELAVRFDESRQDESLLQEPLENGKLHDQKQFVEALRFLEKQTKPPSEVPQSTTRSSTSFKDSLRNLFANRTEASKDTPKFPRHALTPIILSGLVSTIQSDPTSADALGELVVTCQSMRRAAIKRMRNRQLRLKVQRYILPTASSIALLILYVQWIRETIYSLEKLRFMDENYSGYSCEIYSQPYRRACHFAEAHLWTTFEDYLLDDHCSRLNEECLSHKFGSGPLSLQARFSRQLVPIEDVLDDTDTARVIRRDMFRLGKIPRSQPALPVIPETNSSTRPLSWLGASVPGVILRDIFEGYVDDISILDAGCGVGGALWNLMPDKRAVFSYHGISLSQAEVFFAWEMVRRHGLEHENIFFEQRSFDEFLPRNTYQVVLAMESLSYSPRLANTIANLVSTLQPNGFMAIADEFAVAPVTDEMRQTRGAPSMNSISHYISLMETNGCSLWAIREISIEYQFEGYHTWATREEVSFWGRIFYPILAGRYGRLRQLRSDQDDFFRAVRAKKADDESGRTSHAVLVFRKHGIE